MRFDVNILPTLVLVAGLTSCDSAKSTPGALPPPATAVAGSSTAVGKPPIAPPGTPRTPPPNDAPREAKTSGYEITWSATIAPAASAGPERELKLDYAVKALEELYISDRLWDDDIAQRRIADPFGVYRFVQNGSLRLVFAQAPHPPNINLGKTYQPLFSRVLAGETRHQTVRIKLPVDEYSSLDRDVHAPSHIEYVSRIYFVLDLGLRSTMDRAPSPPPRESGDQVGYIVTGAKEIILAMDVDKLPVRRRDGYIARFSLPGEPGPAPLPLDVPR